MVDMYSSPLVTAFDWTTGKYIGRFANRGQGPHEYLWFSAASSFDGKLGLYDENKKEFAWFSYEKDTVCCSSIELAHSDKMFPFKVIALSNEYFVATGLIEENKHFVIYNKEGQKVSVLEIILRMILSPVAVIRIMLLPTNLRGWCIMRKKKCSL